MYTDNDIWQAIRRRRTMKQRHHARKRVTKLTPSDAVREPRVFWRHRLYHINDDIYIGGGISKREQIVRSTLLPRNLRYILNAEDSPFCYKKIKKFRCPSNGLIPIPQNFSITDNPKDSFGVLCTLLAALFVEGLKNVVMDYKECTHVDLTTQVLLDSIILDYSKFAETYNKSAARNKVSYSSTFSGIHINDENVRKMLFSVGTPNVLKIKNVHYDDVTPYYMCRHDAANEKDNRKLIVQKDLDTTDLADYVVDCLAKVNKQLTGDAIDALCTVIGEALINAEEHSTLRYRYSIGYFRDEIVNGKHEGVFRLVIMNFGKSIYEKFKDVDCPNPDIVKKMEELSQKYTKRNLFGNQFQEEALWTLYALQQGVSSISPLKAKRGNGFINFIESFFMIKGSKAADDISRMTIMSGRTRIVFDGHYEIAKAMKGKEEYKTMTFNDSGRIEDPPDKKYVYNTNYYFPGTIISAKIMLNEDDVTIIK